MIMLVLIRDVKGLGTSLFNTMSESTDIGVTKHS